MASHETWHTSHELDYIDELGSHSLIKPDRIKALKKHWVNQKLRSDWGHINKFTIMDRVFSELNGYEFKQTL